MTGPSNKATERLHGTERRKDLTDAFDRALLRAYPVIHDDVIAEVTQFLFDSGFVSASQAVHVRFGKS